MGRPSKDTQPYLFEQFSLDALTVSILALIPESLRQIIDLRPQGSINTFLKNRSSPIYTAAIKLYDLGFDYIDIGTHSDWIAAEIPFSNNPHETALHAAGKILIDLQKTITGG